MLYVQRLAPSGRAEHHRIRRVKGQTDSSRRKHADALCVLALAGTVLTLFAPVVPSITETIVGGYRYHDLTLQYYPWRHFGFGLLREGTIPLWNPYIFCGTPFVAGLQSAIFYPPNWLFLVLSTAPGINVSVMLHVFLAGLFTYLLARTLALGPAASLAAGLVYMLAHPFFYHVLPGHLSNLCTMVWTPLLLLCVERIVRRRRALEALGLAAVVALQVFAGHAQYVLFGLVASALFVAVRCAAAWKDERLAAAVLKPLGLTALGYGLGLALSAAQWIPGVEMASHSMRPAVAGEQWAGLFSLMPENLPGFVAPDWMGDDARFPYWGPYFIWEMSPYVGVLPLVLAAMAVALRRDRYTISFLVIGLLGFVLALGRYGPLFHVVCYVPGYAQFRGSAKFLSLVSLSLAMLAGMGLQAFVPGEARSRRIARLCAIIVAAALGAAVLAAALMGSMDAARSANWAGFVEHLLSRGERAVAVGWASRQNMLTRMFAMLQLSVLELVVVLLGCMAALVCGLRSRSRWLWAGVAIAVIAANLWYYDHATLLTTPTAYCRWDPAVVAKLQMLQQPFRVWHHGRAHVNSAMTERMAIAEGYDSNVIRYYGEYLDILLGEEPTTPRLATRFPEAVPRWQPAFRLLNVRYEVLGPALAPDQELVWSSQDHRLVRNRSALPRALFVRRAVRIDSWLELQKSLRRDAPGEPQVILAEAPPGAFASASGVAVMPRFVHYSEHRVSLDVETDTPGWLVLSDAWYPGWRAFVDGAEARILRANYAFRAVAVSEPGPHRVEFAYEPPSFKAGVALTLAAAAFAVAACVMCATTAALSRRKKALKDRQTAASGGIIDY